MEIFGYLLNQLWFGGCIYFLIVIFTSAYIEIAKPKAGKWLTNHFLKSMKAWHHILIIYVLGWLYMTFYF